MKIHWTIKQKLTGLFVLVGLIPLILLAGLSINRIRTEFRKNAFKDLTSVQAEKQEQLQELFHSYQEVLDDLVARVSRQKQERLDSLKVIQDLKREQVQAYFNRLETNLLQLVENEAVRVPLLEGINPTDPRDESQDQQEAIDYNRFLRDYDFLSLVWIDADGKVRQSVGSVLKPGIKLTADDPLHTDLLLAGQRAAADPERLIVVESDLEGSKQNSTSFLAAAAVVNSRGKVLGTLVADVPYQELDQLLRDRAGLGKTGESYLVSHIEADQVVLRSTPFFIGTGQYRPGSVLADLAGVYDRSASSGRSGSGLYLDGEKQLTLAVFEPLDLPWVDWSLVTRMHADEVFFPESAEESRDPFQELLDQSGYGNVFLVSKFGSVFYTAVPDPTLGTNLIGGPYSRTNLASLIRSVQVNSEPGFADFYPYSPLDNLPAAFLAAPVLSVSQQVDLVIALQITNSEINQILHARAGLGESGEIYLTGQDHYLRSDSFLAPDRISMVNSFSGELASLPIPEQVIEDALAGETGMDEYLLETGEYVFSTYSPIQVLGSSWGMITQKDAAEVYSSANDLMWILLGASGVVLLLVLVLGISFGNQLSSPISLLTRTAQPLSGGDLELSDKQQASLEKLRRRTDEFGELASSFSNLIDYLQSLAARAVEIAGGDLRNDVKPRPGRDQLGTAFSDMTTQLRNVLSQISAYSASVNLSADQLAAAAGETRQASDQISDSIQEINLGLQTQAKNLDLTRNSVQQMITAVDGVAVGAQDQAHAAGQSADITNQINAAITNVAKIAQLGAAESAQASQKAREGTAAVDNNLMIMDQIQVQVAASVEKVQQMGQSSREIDQIVEAIETIASETNLLALNAAIEAARAGEHGKGFAVVADEVRKLADESKTATAQISGILASIEAAIQDAVESMEYSSREVSRGVDSSRDTGQALEEIIRAAERVSEQVEMIAATAEELNASGNQLVASHQTVTAVIEENSAATEEISAGSEDVSTAINEIVKVSEDNADSAGEVSQSVSGLRSQVADVMIASLGLHQLAVDLNQVMDGFQLKQGSGAGLHQGTDPGLTDPQEKMINGSGILYRKNYVLDRFGDREWSLVLDSLPGDARAILERPINPSLKYPQRVYSGLIEAIRNQLANGNVDQFNREMAAYVAQAEVTGIYQPIMEASTPLEMLSKLPVLWQIQVPEGRMTCREVADQEVEISFNHQVDQELCQNSLVGYISGLLEIFAVKNPSVSHTSCIYQGDDQEVYSVRWDE